MSDFDIQIKSLFGHINCNECDGKFKFEHIILALHFLERDEKLTALKEEWKSTIGMTNVQIMRMKHFLRSKAH